MTIDLSKLDSLTKPELMKIAVESGVKVHHKAGEKTIKEAIVNQVMNPPAKQEDLSHKAAKPVAPVYYNTPDDVERLVAKIKASNPRFKTSYDTDENTWLFQWVSESGRVMREEAGNLSIPPRVIKMRADNIARGPLLLRTMNKHFDDMGGNTNSKNAYANTVL